MALTVEDGTNVAGADSYIDTAFVDTYAADRGVTGWAKLAGAAKEQAIRIAQEFMFVEYSERWKGDRANADQALDWPRTDVCDRSYNEIASDSIPVDVQNAQAEYALVQGLETGGLFFTPPVSATGGDIEEIEQQADVVKQRIKYVAGTKATRRRFPKADGLVRYYLRARSGLAVRL